jgi:hypothetical protein
VNNSLSATVAATVLLILMPQSSAQQAWFGPPASHRHPTMYQPTMTAMMFQSGDMPVPAPSDPGGSPATLGTQPAPNQFFTDPSNGSIITSPDMTLPTYPDSTWNAFSPPVVADPFLQPNYGSQMTPYAPYSPYQQGMPQPGIPQQGTYAYGANPAQPYRFGWQNRIDVSWLPGGGVSGPVGGATGDHDIFGIDYELAYGSPITPGWVLNWTNQFSYRNWDGPSGGIGLPSDVFRFGIDLEMETPKSGPFSISLGITPSINTDFDADAWDEGFQLDGRGIMLFQLDQYWTLGLGAMYWDRVDDHIIPWAGLIYRDDWWEWQLMYPEARVSLFLGNEAYWSKWAYVRAEYHVEAYGVNRRFGAVYADDQVEISDYRILLGLKMDSGLYSWFFEGGWVLDRQVEFASNAPGYDIDTGFIGQIGLRY